MALFTSAASGQGAQRTWATRLRGWLGLPAAFAASPRQVASINGAAPYVGELALFCGNYAPQNWALCNGQSLASAKYPDLFNLIGTTYGGDGYTTFNLPDMRSRVPVHQGQGPGLSSYFLGQMAGVENVTLATYQLPSHTHALPASAAPGTTASPVGAVPALSGNGSAQYTPDYAYPGYNVSPLNLGATGGGQAHPNVQPVLAVNYIIALYGVTPSFT